MAKKTDSPAIQLLRLLWRHEGHQMGHSWERINATMRNGLGLAIRSGLEFARGDFAVISDAFNPGCWLNGERMYSVACLGEHGPNRSAAISFERWKGRKPFILDGHRLAVGSKFDWYDDRVTVTSFADDSSYLVACSYKYTESNTGDTYARRKVAHRYKIAIADLRELVARQKLYAQLSTAVGRLDQADRDTLLGWRKGKFQGANDRQLRLSQLREIEAKINELAETQR